MKHTSQFILTFSQEDLRNSGKEELLPGLSEDTRIQRIDWEAMSEKNVAPEGLFSLSSPELTVLNNGFPEVRKSNFKTLCFHPTVLAGVYAQEGVDRPRLEHFTIVLLEGGEEQVYTQEIEYLANSYNFYNAGLSWNFSDVTEVDLTATPKPEVTQIGTLKVDNGKAPVNVAFQMWPHSEEGEEIKYPLNGAGISLFNRSARGITPLGGNVFRCEFDGLSKDNYPLTINTNWLEDSRITSIKVWWEGEFSQPKTFTIANPEMTDHPQIRQVTFHPVEEVTGSAGLYTIQHPFRRTVKFGHLEVEVIDPRSKGYRIEGTITADKQQKDLPLDLSTGKPPAGVGVSEYKGEGDDFSSKKTSFVLLDNEKIGEATNRPWFRRYVHKVPLSLRADKLSFQPTNPDCRWSTFITLNGVGDQPYTFPLTVLVKGHDEADLLSEPVFRGEQEMRSFEMPLLSKRPEKNIYKLTLTNKRTKRLGDYISVKLRNISLISTLDEEKADWRLELRVERVPVVFDENGETPILKTLDGGEQVQVDFILHPTDAISTRSGEEELELSWEIAYTKHKSADPGQAFQEEEVLTEQRSVPFSVRPVVQTNYVSIDLGTSAIVAAYTNSNRKANGLDFEFFDLQKRLEEIRNTLSEDDADIAYRADQQPEGNTRFISSNILLSNDKKVKSPDPRESMIELSASEGTINRNIDRWLPNIKMLFGGAGVSKLKKAFDKDFSVTTTHGKLGPYPWDDPAVIRYSMHALVHTVMDYYILQDPLLTSRADDHTEVVFTVPNNFNEDYRREIIDSAEIERDLNHPGISVSFVSESDAVAYSYLDHLRILHPDRNLEDKETILAYDIGAGTVDISLVNRRVNPKNRQESQLYVKGRIGLPKAGNYLDYVIARIVWELYGLESEASMIAIEDPFELPDSQDARKFHKWIREDLKPAIGLVDPDDRVNQTMYQIEEQSLFPNPDKQTINLFDIIEHEDFVTYLREVTETAFVKLFYNAYAAGTYEQVDTILYSGRTSQMKCLKVALKNALGSMRGQSITKVKEVTSENWRMANLKMSDEKLKGIVALGGLRYLIKYRDLNKKDRGHSLQLGSRHLMAGYGIVFNQTTDASDVWKYEELIRPITANENRVSREVEIDLGGAEEMFLIQTYDQNEEAVLQGFDGRKFIGDYSIDLNKGQPIKFSQEGINGDEVTEVAIEIVAGKSLFLRLLDRNKQIIWEDEFENYRLGYNTQSPAISESLWPFIDPKEQQ